MANQIHDLPTDQDFGLEFNYALWTANTEITLTNVPWNNDYRDVVWFDNSAALNAYIDESDSENTRISNSQYAPVDRPIQLDIPFNIASRFNYVRVFNRGQSFTGADVPKYFYYFITNTRYVTTHNTEFVVQLDIFQTYIRQVQFGKCYIERGHIGIANQDSFRNFGRDFLGIPEGLDLGSEYVNIAHRRVDIMNANADGYDILVISTTALEYDGGTKTNPDLVTAQPSNYMNIPSGAAFYVFPGANAFRAFMRSKATKPWITQGIISITAIPRLSRYFPTLTRAVNAIGSLQYPGTGSPQMKEHKLWTEWRNSNDINNYIPPRYRNLKKLLTSPYLMIEATTWNATPIMIKPEMWNSSDAIFREYAALIPPETRVTFWPASYNSRFRPLDDDNNSRGYSYAGDGGEYLDFATHVTSFPRFAMVNNGALSALAGQAHSLAYANQSADWSQQRALRGNEVGYDQATMGMATAANENVTQQRQDYFSTGIGNQLSQDTAMLSAISGIASGAAGGAIAGGAKGAAAGAISGTMGAAFGLVQNGINVQSNNSQLAQRLATSSEMSRLGQNNAGYVRDTNKSMADWAARGDYENTIAGINARAQDLRLTQPSTSGQMGGEYLNFLMGNVGLNVRWKMLDQAAMSVIGEYWLRYGYAVRRSSFLPPNLMTMSKFTYWKLTETYIRKAPIPEGFKQALRGIFEKGVTVWADPDYIGVTDFADNEPLPGITLEGYTPPIPEIEPPIDPPVIPKRKKRKMLVFSSIDGEGPVWALAGTSPGTTVNWIETRDETRALAFQAACDAPAVAVAASDFALYKSQYIAALVVLEVGTEPEPDPEPVA